MIITPIEFAAAFMFLTTLLLLGVIYSRIYWTIKAFLVVSSLAFTVFAYNSYQSALGYPVAINPPDEFEFLFGNVSEPTAHSSGAIYIWIYDPRGKPEPRALQIPYSHHNRDIVAEAKKKVKAGERVFVRKTSSDKPDGQSDADGSSGVTGTGNSDDHRAYHVGKLELIMKPPQDTLPKKIVP